MSGASIFFLALILSLSTPVSIGAQTLKLSYGTNAIDIDGDGTPDLVTRSYLDNANNNNADFYQIMVRRTVKGRRGPVRAWNLVPLISGEKRYEVFSGQVGECIWNDVRFVREKAKSGRSQVYLYLFSSDPVADKPGAGEHDVSVERYRFEEKRSDREPGDPPMAFVLDRKETVRSGQCGVQGADELLGKLSSARKEESEIWQNQSTQPRHSVYDSAATETRYCTSPGTFPSRCVTATTTRSGTGHSIPAVSPKDNSEQTTRSAF
ncbi:MAG TPA: hypothetical protein VKZ53_16020 [Candidatus Angelobacter sp.]|nr:hypothetical protein [Candidatus Angelobacter sp.]